MKEFENCDKCGKTIYFEERHITVTRNEEYASKELAQIPEDDINSNAEEWGYEIIESELILTLCKSCGDNFNSLVLDFILKSSQLGVKPNVN